MKQVRSRVNVDDLVNANVKVHVQGKVQVQAKIKGNVKAHFQVKVLQQGAW